VPDALLLDLDQIAADLDDAVRVTIRGRRAIAGSAHRNAHELKAIRRHDAVLYARGSCRISPMN
jgi:hypothetical protein